ncbi:HNH endonuclease signature motif containing protein [Brachybacterium sp. DNPG3]
MPQPCSPAPTPLDPAARVLGAATRLLADRLAAVIAEEAPAAAAPPSAFGADVAGRILDPHDRARAVKPAGMGRARSAAWDAGQRAGRTRGERSGAARGYAAGRRFGRREREAELLPPCKPVRACRPHDPDAFAARAQVEPDSFEALAARELHGMRAEINRVHAQQLRSTALLWDDEDPDPAGDAFALLVADARRVTLPRARALLRDAVTAVSEMHRTFDRFEQGHFPVEWHEIMLRRVRRLTAEQRILVDARVSEWDLENISMATFLRNLGLLIAWFRDRTDEPSPLRRRHVQLDVDPDGDGTASLTVTGPLPEILDLSRRLDLAARSVQDAQRRALDADEPVPFDLDGEAQDAGRASGLGALRYAILQRTVLATPGVDTRGSRYRLQVVVPMLTLLGRSDAPAVIGGIHPLPASLARKLAADEPVWHRILTDPADGRFLPVPARQYRPTAEMAEHLRLLNPVCAVPGCIVDVGGVGEMDHIEEFDHAHPERGGPTAVENLHRLCRPHHRMKTDGELDVLRAPDGTCTWIVRGRRLEGIEAEHDLITPLHAAMLASIALDEREQEVWEDIVRSFSDAPPDPSADEQPPTPPDPIPLHILLGDPLFAGTAPPSTRPPF